VIVGGSPDGRGVVSAASYEARRYGVRSAMPSAQAARLCPDGVWVWPRMERYLEFSRRIRDVFEDETPRVEPISVDEAFLDVTPGFGGEHPIAVARRIRKRIAEMGLTASVGVATSKTVAKIASDRDKPDGLTVVEPGREAAFLAPLPIEVMSGIGAVTQRSLERLGIRTLGDLAAVDLETASATLGSHGPELVRRSRGIDERPVSSGRSRKSVSHERTFGADVTDAEEAHGAIRRLAAGVSRRLRAKGLAGRTVTVKLRFSDFTTRTIQRTLDAPVFLEHDIAALASTLLDEAWSPGAGLRLLGVGVSGFEEPLEQLDLFAEATETADDERRRKLTESLDEVAGRFGTDAIGFGPSRRIRPATPAYDPPEEPDER
jgi:DNA polymerase-4